MIIAGAGGFAKEVLELVYRQYPGVDINFYDDYTIDGPILLYNQFPVFKSIDEAAAYFKKNNSQFVLGIGKPQSRYALFEKFLQVGGTPVTIMSNDAKIGSFGNIIDEGVTIMQGVKITNSVQIGKGCLLNLNCTIGHDSLIGNFCELSPGVHISGNCEVGDLCSIGTNAVLLPGIKLGKNVIVGAGAVVTKNMPDNVTLTGIPAKIISNGE